MKQQFPRFADIVDGKPIMVLKDDEWQTGIMGKMRLQDTDVMAAARGKGVKSLSQIKYAILERNGAISIIKKDS